MKTIGIEFTLSYQDVDARARPARRPDEAPMSKLDSVRSLVAAATPGAHDPSVCTLAIIEWRERAAAALQVASRAILEGNRLRGRVAELEADPGLSVAESVARRERLPGAPPPRVRVRTCCGVRGRRSESRSG
jgi:hypothetical protein